MQELQNEIVRLDQEGKDLCVIYSLVEERPVGTISLKDEKENGWQLFVQIQMPYRHRHYASYALDLMDPYAHQVLGVDEIHAVIDADHTDARHLLEHHGYQLQLKNEGLLYYVHRPLKTTKDDAYHPDGLKVLYLAGGCFWGMQKAFDALNGVRKTVCGYANGRIQNPTYEEVCRNDAGFKETVRVSYDPSVLSTKTLLTAYFMCIDPTVKNAQAHDEGEQYQTGIYYRDASLLKEIQPVYDAEKEKYDSFFVELKPLENFWEAEEYHQNYLEKHPDGYCHINADTIAAVKKLNQ